MSALFRRFPLVFQPSGSIPKSRLLNTKSNMKTLWSAFSHGGRIPAAVGAKHYRPRERGDAPSFKSPSGKTRWPTQPHATGYGSAWFDRPPQEARSERVVGGKGQGRVKYACAILQSVGAGVLRRVSVSEGEVFIIVYNDRRLVFQSVIFDLSPRSPRPLWGREAHSSECIRESSHNLASKKNDRISFDSVVSYFRLKLPAHGGTLVCISTYTCWENAKNWPEAILLCSAYANYRNPAGYTQWSCDVKSPLASYPSSGQIFGSFPIEALRIAFRRAHRVNLREVS